MTALLAFVGTPDGPFGVIGAPDGTVLASGWTDSADALLGRLRPEARPVELHSGWGAGVRESIEAYYGGDHDAVDAVPVAQTGGPFRQDAWRVLRRIVAGHPLTYAQFAAATGRPAAVRAAASACATNAVALFVPCHRVLRTDGTFGGFAWGTDVKRALLAREAAPR